MKQGDQHSTLELALAWSRFEGKACLLVKLPIAAIPDDLAPLQEGATDPNHLEGTLWVTSNEILQ